MSELQSSKSWTFKAFFKDILFVVVVYMIITTFAYGAFHIPSSSMEPTLEVGDRIFVAKYPYGYNRFTFPFDPEVLPEGRLFDEAPERGDIVVFTLPHRNDTDFIKRVIGLPGDIIEVRSGRLYINGSLVKRELVREVSFTSYEGIPTRASEYIETLPNGVEHRIYERSDRGRGDTFDAYKVPENHYFMMGDNRDSSADSRDLTNMGAVHKKYLVGRADITTFSFYDCDQGKDIACLWVIPVGRFFNILD